VDPERFMPERWMDESRNELNILHDFWGFGAGRRICVGYKIAQQILFLAISQLIFCFDFVEVCFVFG
jgi:cytochrome P450